MQYNFNTWYKRTFEKLSEVPSDDIWNNIVNVLDKEDEIRRKRGAFIRISILAGLLLIGSIIGVNYTVNSEKEILASNSNVTQNVKNTFETASEGREVKVPEDRPAVNSENLKNSYPNLQNIYTTNRSENNTIAFKPEHLSLIEVNESDTRTGYTEFLKNNLFITSNNSAPDSFIIYQSKNNLTEVLIPDSSVSINNDNQILDTVVAIAEKSETDSSVSKKSNNKIPKGLYIGSAYILNNIWLMNHDTYNGLKSSELNRTQIDFGSAYGIVIGYNLSDKLSFQGEWLMNIKGGQKYNIYREGVQYSNRISLNYTQANLLIKRKNVRLNSTNLKGTWNKIAGAYLGYLKSATEQTIFYEKDIKQNYNSFNYGIILGLEYEVYFNDRWIVSSGLTTNVGLKNIYKGTFREPDDFNKTSVLNLGINFGVKYLITP